MLIYRIENSMGTGPYQGAGPATDPRYRTLERHPSPAEDPALGYYNTKKPSSYSFGFKSIEQLKFWFFTEEIREKMHNAGFVVSVYKAQDYRLSDAQAIFAKATAKKVSELPLIDL